MKAITPLDPVVVHQLGDSRRWEVAEQWACFLQIDGALHQITIPAGFIFDRASVPDLAGILITRDSLGCAGPLVHDAIYRADGRLAAPSHFERVGFPPGSERLGRINPFRVFTRAEADEALRVICLADGVSRWRAWLAWAAVRCFAPKW